MSLSEKIDTDGLSGREDGLPHAGRARRFERDLVCERVRGSVPYGFKLAEVGAHLVPTTPTPRW